MSWLDGKRVLITGAASGIGLCTAEEFARAGCELIITDLNEGALKKAARQLRKLGAKVQTECYDVSKPKQVQEVAGRVGEIDILINNAGIGYTNELADTSLATWKKLVDVNLWGPLYHVYAYLPQMRARHTGHIVNVSSGQAFFKLPTWGAYACIKAALGTFSEILHYEVKRDGVTVTTVYPFMVNTGFYNDVQGESWGTRLSMKLLPYYSMSPERVGRILFKAVKRRQKVEKVSLLNELGYYANFVPLAPEVIARASYLFLGKRAQA
ncbi:MAG: SDR family oxidoreductase [Pseudomonadota bacterium]